MATTGMTMRANRMPAPTWSWLAINEAAVELPADLAPAGPAAVELEASAEVECDFGSFVQALSALDGRYPARRDSAPGDAADRARIAHNADESLNVPALSAYQTKAIHLEEACGPASSFSRGMGDDAASFLRATAIEPICLDIPAGNTVDATVRVEGISGRAGAADVSIVAREGSHLTLTIHLDTPEQGHGYVGSLLSVIAEAHARVDIVCIQTLDDSWVALDASGYVLDESARVNVRHVVLGAGKSYTGLSAELWGTASRIDVVTSYLGRHEQERDFNYQIRHLGRKTISNMDADGVLAGACKKVLRGTIDLVHGCKGAEGTEHESVLLADERVDNKTVPTILCDEDDVAGNHGATIGHAADDQLYYLGTRGLNAQAAETLFARSKFESALALVDDKRIREGILRIADDDIELFEGEAAC